MAAIVLLRHSVADFAIWHRVYQSFEALRCKHACTLERVMGHTPGDPNDVVVLHEFPNLTLAQGFVDDPELQRAMKASGVRAPLRVEIFES